MHLILNCHHLDSTLTPALVVAVESLPVSLTLCTKPGRDHVVAYDSTYLRLPKCRLIAAWSEQESLAAAVTGWRDDVACWWPVTSTSDWPGWGSLSHLLNGYQRVFDAVGKACPVGFAGINSSGLPVEHQNCSCVACDALAGPLMFHRTQAAGVATRELEGLPAGVALCMAVAINQRRCCYQTPDYGLRVDRVNFEWGRGGWRSRIS